jgi:hypothetical protein
MNSIIYLLQVTACTAVFYLFYYLFLNRLTFFVTNRWYLLVTVILSFAIPLIKIPVNEPHAYTGVVQQVVYTYAQQNFVPIEATPQIVQHIAAKPTLVHWGDVLKFAYLAAVLALTVHLAFTLIAFFKRMRGKRITKMGNVNILSSNEKITNGSFLNYIFLNDQELSADEIQQIIAHEMLHVKLYHSVDRIIVKIAQIILWFNPFIYLYARSVEENHEFEVDRAVARNTDKHNYANLLLHLSVAGQGMLYHNFSKVPLKKRITMLFNQPSANMKKIVYVLIVPVVLISCLAFAGMKSNSKIAVNPKTKSTAIIGKKKLPTMAEWVKSAKAYDKTPEGKRRIGLMETMRGKTIDVTIASVVNNKYVKDRVDHISFNYNGDKYGIYFGYRYPLRMKSPLSAGDAIKVQIRSLSFMYLNDSLEISPAAIYKGNERIFKSHNDSSPAGVVKNTVTKADEKATIDTTKYHQKGTPKDAATVKNRQEALAYVNSPEGQEKSKLCREIAGKTITVTVKKVIPNEVRKIEPFKNNGGVLVDYNGNEYLMQTWYGQSKQLQDLLKAGDEITLKVFSTSFRKDAPVLIRPANITRNNVKIYQLAEADKIPDYPFLYEANKVRFADGQISRIVKYANGKWKSALFETVNGYKFNLSFKPTSPNLNSIGEGDHVRLRFVHEVKTAAKAYSVNDWVSISTDIKDYGVKNPEMFNKFYEPVKQAALVEPELKMRASDSARADKNGIYTVWCSSHLG